MLILVRKLRFAAYYDGQRVEIAETREKGSEEKSGETGKMALWFLSRDYLPLSAGYNEAGNAGKSQKKRFNAEPGQARDRLEFNGVYRHLPHSAAVSCNS